MAIRSKRDSTPVWRKSRRSGGTGACVEVALTNSHVLVRDSRDRLGTRLVVSPAQWRRFVGRLKDGEVHLG
jgi:Domain of unknown function (DUF397)